MIDVLFIITVFINGVMLEPPKSFMVVELNAGITMEYCEQYLKPAFFRKFKAKIGNDVYINQHEIICKKRR